MPPPDYVVADEIIETEWGNEVIDWMAELVKLEGVGVGPFTDHLAFAMNNEVVTTNGAGAASIAYPFTFSAAVPACGNGDISAAFQLHPFGLTTTGFQVFVRNASTGDPILSTAVRVMWVAMGVRS